MIETEQDVAADTQRPLPDGWRWVRLGKVCNGNILLRDPRYEADRPFKYVDITSVDNVAKKISDPKTLQGRDTPSRARQIIRARDVIVATTRPYLNAVALVPEELDSQIASTGFCVLRAGPEMDSDYLFAFVRSQEFVEALSLLVRGALYPAVTDSQVRGQWIPLPPLTEQRRIAAILREQTAAVERARAAAEAQLEAARALPAAYLRAVFESNEAREWPRVSLASVGQLMPAKSIASVGDTPVRAVTTACLTESGFDPAGIKVARMWRRDATESILVAGEILIARSNTSDLVGRTAMYEGSPQYVVASDLTIRILPHTFALSGFLAAYLSWLYLIGYWKERAGGASDSMKKITRTQILALEVPLPATQAQRHIAAVLDEQTAGAQQIRRMLQEQLDTIEALPAALLRQAFSGEL